MELKPYFDAYLAVRGQADAAFEKVRKEYRECVTCKEGCADCCHALFDLSLVEAMYINRMFLDTFSPEQREALLEECNRADRTIYKIKRKAFRDHRNGKPEGEILEEMAAVKVRCPMLDERDRCRIYSFRPITCRLYGAPTTIGGRSYTCGLTRFKQGESYPTVYLDRIQAKLHEISMELALGIGTKYPGLHEMLVPLSMALLTVYDEDYLGVRKRQAEGGRTDETG